jgi:hypothetical protein
MGPDYPRTYPLTPSLRVLAVLAGLILLAYAAAFVLLSVRHGFHSFVAMPLAALVVGTVGVWVIGYASRSKVVLTADAIELHGFLQVQHLARADIAGRRTIRLYHSGTRTQLVSGRAGVSSLSLPLSSMKTDALFDDWIGELPDLDARDLQASAAAVAAEPALGQTPEERMARLASTRKVAANFHAVTLIAALWIYLAPQADLLAILVLVLLPWLAIVRLARSSHLCRFDFENDRTDVRPNLALIVVMPGLMLVLCANCDVSVFDWQRALAAGALTATVLSCAVLRSNVGRHAPPAAALVLWALTCAYGYGAVVLLDSGLDLAAHNHYKVAVLARHGHRGFRTSSYHLTLAPWGPRSKPSDVRVRRALYARMPPGSTVCVEDGPGALGISWYVVSACE